MMCDRYFCWRKHYMLTDFIGDTSFHQYWLPLHHTGWFFPHPLCWNCNGCPRTLPGIHMCWPPFTRLPVMRSGRTRVQDMGNNPTLWWGCPSWSLMVPPWYSPMSCILLHQEVCYQVFLVLYSWMLLYPLCWDWTWHIEHDKLNVTNFDTQSQGAIQTKG